MNTMIPMYSSGLCPEVIVPHTPLPRRKLIVSLDRVWTAIEERARPIEQMGLSTQGLLRYAIEHVTNGTYAAERSDVYLEKMAAYNLMWYLEKEIREVSPDIMLNTLAHKRLTHQCMDFIGEVAAIIQPLFIQVVGRCDPTVRVESFLGRDIVVSIPYPRETY